jgi:nucleoside-diphosphate-sugar epimerase
MDSVVVTGADGFIGQWACALLESRGVSTIRVVRRADGPGKDRRVVPDLVSQADWQGTLAGGKAVLHLGARVHVIHEAAVDPQGAFHRVNVDATRRLAIEASKAGIHRFVFVSSIGVNGNQTRGRAFTEADNPNPQGPYAQSKLEAEVALSEVARTSKLEVVTIRPPLVYGPGVKANFLRLLRWVDRGVPLPLASVRNQRSLVYVGNLCSAFVRCLEHADAAGRTFLVDDGRAVSTPELVRGIGRALARPVRLIACPPSALRLGAALLGRRDDAERLVGDLVVDASAITQRLGWTPPYSLDEGLAATAAWYRSLARAPE